MKKLFAVAIVMLGMLSTGCATVTIGSRVNVYNGSPFPVQTVVRGQDVGPVVPPNSSRAFRVDIEAPVQSGGSFDPTNSTTQVSATLRNLQTGRLLPVQYCTAGEKYVMTLNYTYQVFGSPPNTSVSENLYCTSTY